MSNTTEHGALQQLQQQQSKLLDKIDELRTIGVGGLVELPQLIVCGNQSSGKSSVLEAISRVRFPTKSNVCTRFATEVILRRSQVPKIKISIEPGPSRSSDDEKRKQLRGFSHEGFSDGNDLPALIEKATDHMGISETVNSGFSDDILKVEISGPEKPELTLVDLPGLYYSISQEQGKEGIAIVRSLTEKYMANSRSIIMAVISAKTDYHLQEVLNIAEKFDPQRQRTLGIITQPDILEPNSEEEETYLKFVQNRKIQLRLGWHALRNRSFETRDASDVARDTQERDFFGQGQWTSIPQEFVGVGSLRRRLSTVLLNHIQQNLPGLIADIQSKILDREQRLERLGGARSTLQQQRGFLLKISSNFERIAGQALNGMYTDRFFSETGDDKNGRLLRATVRQLNDYFSEAMTFGGGHREIVDAGSPSPTFPVSTTMNPYLAGWVPKVITRAALEAESAELARQNRGVELPGSANQLLVGNLFRDQSKPWEELAKTHLLKAWEAVRYFVLLLLHHLTDEHTAALLVGTVVEPKLEDMKQALLRKLDELTSYLKRGHPLPVGNSFLTQIQKARSKRILTSLKAKLTSERPMSPDFSMQGIERAITDLEHSRDEFAAGEIVDQMQAYYDVAIVTFVDNVATLGIENCLLEPLERLFTSQVVNDMEDTQIQQIAAEPLYMSEERSRLSGDLDKLQAGLRTFNMFRPVLSPLSNSFISGDRGSSKDHAQITKPPSGPEAKMSSAASQNAANTPVFKHLSASPSITGGAAPSNSSEKNTSNVVADLSNRSSFGGTPKDKKGKSRQLNNSVFDTPSSNNSPGFGSTSLFGPKIIGGQSSGSSASDYSSGRGLFDSPSEPTGAQLDDHANEGSAFLRTGSLFASIGSTSAASEGKSSSGLFSSTPAPADGVIGTASGVKSSGGPFGSASTSLKPSDGGFGTASGVQFGGGLFGSSAKTKHGGFGAIVQNNTSGGSMFGTAHAFGESPPLFGTSKMPPSTKDEYRTIPEWRYDFSAKECLFHISALQEFIQYSPEELRLGDYARGNIVNIQRTVSSS